MRLRHLHPGFPSCMRATIFIVALIAAGIPQVTPPITIARATGAINQINAAHRTSTPNPGQTRQVSHQIHLSTLNARIAPQDLNGNSPKPDWRGADLANTGQTNSLGPVSQPTQVFSITLDTFGLPLPTQPPVTPSPVPTPSPTITPIPTNTTIPVVRVQQGTTQGIEFDGQGNVIFSLSSGVVESYNPISGTMPGVDPLNWQSNLGTSIGNDLLCPASQPVAGSDGAIYIGGDNGNLFQINGQIPNSSSSIVTNTVPSPDGTSLLFVTHTLVTPQTIFTSNGRKSFEQTPKLGPGNTLYVGDAGGNFYKLSVPAVGSGLRATPIYTFTATGTETSSAPHKFCGEAALDNAGDAYVASIDTDPNSGISDLGTVYKIDPTGRSLWAVALQGMPIGAVMLAPNPTNPSQTLVIVQDEAANVTAFDAATGNVAWTFVNYGQPPFLASPALSRDGSTVYSLDSAGTLFGLNLATGALNPNFGTGGQVSILNGSNASPIVDGAGNIYIQSNDGTLYAFDSTGAQLWAIPHGFAPGDTGANGPKFLTPAIAANDTIYVGGTGTTVRGFQGPTPPTSTPTNTPLVVGTSTAAAQQTATAAAGQTAAEATATQAAADTASAATATEVAAETGTAIAAPSATVAAQQTGTATAATAVAQETATMAAVQTGTATAATATAAAQQTATAVAAPTATAAAQTATAAAATATMAAQQTGTATAATATAAAATATMAAQQTGTATAATATAAAQQTGTAAATATAGTATAIAGQTATAIAGQTATAIAHGTATVTATLTTTNWEKFRGDLGNTGMAPVRLNMASTPGQFFALKVGNGGTLYTSPVIGPDGTIYQVDDSGHLVAITPNGSVKWTSASVLGTHQVSIGVTAQFPFDLGSSPAIAPDGTIVVGSESGGIYRFDPATGNNTRVTGNGKYIGGSVIVGSNGTVYAGSLDGHVYSIPLSSAGYTFNVSSECSAGYSAFVQSTPALDSQGNLYVGYGCRGSDTYYHGGVLALNSAGTLLWNFTYHLGTGQSMGEVASAITLNPNSSTHALYAIDNTENAVYSLNTQTGQMNWSGPYQAAAAINCSPAVSPDGTLVYVGAIPNSSPSGSGHPEGFVALNATTGALVGSSSEINVGFSSPAVDAAGNIIMGFSDGHLQGYGPNLGTPNFDQTVQAVGAGIYGGPVIGPDGTIYVTNRSGYLIALKAGIVQPTPVPPATIPPTATQVPQPSDTPVSLIPTPSNTPTVPPGSTNTPTVPPGSTDTPQPLLSDSGSSTGATGAGPTFTPVPNIGGFGGSTSSSGSTDTSGANNAGDVNNGQGSTSLSGSTLKTPAAAVSHATGNASAVKNLLAGRVSAPVAVPTAARVSGSGFKLTFTGGTLTAGSILSMRLVTSPRAHINYVVQLSFVLAPVKTKPTVAKKITPARTKAKVTKKAAPAKTKTISTKKTSSVKTKGTTTTPKVSSSGKKTGTVTKSKAMLLPQDPQMALLRRTPITLAGLNLASRTAAGKSVPTTTKKTTKPSTKATTTSKVKATPTKTKKTVTSKAKVKTTPAKTTKKTVASSQSCSGPTVASIHGSTAIRFTHVANGSGIDVFCIRLAAIPARSQALRVSMTVKIVAGKTTFHPATVGPFTVKPAPLPVIPVQQVLQNITAVVLHSSVFPNDTETLRTLTAHGAKVLYRISYPADSGGLTVTIRHVADASGYDTVPFRVSYLPPLNPGQGVAIVTIEATQGKRTAHAAVSFVIQRRDALVQLKLQVAHSLVRPDGTEQISATAASGVTLTYNVSYGDSTAAFTEKANSKGQALLRFRVSYLPPPGKRITATITVVATKGSTHTTKSVHFSIQG